MTVLFRRSARVLLIDESDDVLLVHSLDPARPHVRSWYTPGGGIDPGEDPRDAAAREVYEEIGLRVDPASLDGPHQRETVTFSFDGMTVHQDHEFYCVAVRRFHPRPMQLSDLERRSTLEVCWVPVAEIPALADPVYPTTLPELVATFRASVSRTGPRPCRRNPS